MKNTQYTETLRQAIRELQEYYNEMPNAEKPLQYDFGFFDAVGVLEGMLLRAEGGRHE